MATQSFSVVVDYATLVGSALTEVTGTIEFTPVFGAKDTWTTIDGKIVVAKPWAQNITSIDGEQTFLLAHPEGWPIGFYWTVTAIVDGVKVFSKTTLLTPAPNSVNQLPNLVDWSGTPYSANAPIEVMRILAGVTDGQYLIKEGPFIKGVTGGPGGGGAVASVNNKTGVVVLSTADLADFEEAVSLASPVQSVNGQQGEVNLTITAPVTSVNSKTGDVVIGTADLANFNAAVDARVQNIVGAAPAALDTLAEIADALGDDANYAATITGQLALKANQSSISNINNTSDANKPVSTAQLAALNGKADVVIYTGTALTYKGATITQWPAGLTGPCLVLGYDNLLAVPAWVPDTAYVVVDADNTVIPNLGRLAGINNQVGTSYTPVLSDEGKLITAANASTIAFTIPTDASVPIPVGGSILFAQRGSGSLTFAGASGVTLLPATPSVAGINLSVVATKIAANTWLFTGALA